MNKKWQISNTCDGSNEVSDIEQTGSVGDRGDALYPIEL